MPSIVTVESDSLVLLNLRKENTLFSLLTNIKPYSVRFSEAGYLFTSGLKVTLSTVLYAMPISDDY